MTIAYTTTRITGALAVTRLAAPAPDVTLPLRSNSLPAVACAILRDAGVSLDRAPGFLLQQFCDDWLSAFYGGANHDCTIRQEAVAQWAAALLARLEEAA